LGNTQSEARITRVGIFFSWKTILPYGFALHTVAILFAISGRMRAADIDFTTFKGMGDIAAPEIVLWQEYQAHK
jgi:hypothetical protein